MSNTEVNQDGPGLHVHVPTNRESFATIAGPEKYPSVSRNRTFLTTLSAPSPKMFCLIAISNDGKSFLASSPERHRARFLSQWLPFPPASFFVCISNNPRLLLTAMIKSTQRWHSSRAVHLRPRERQIIACTPWLGRTPLSHID